jgi:hypothetical protein
MYAGCVSGAIQMDEYLGLIEQTGFCNIKIQKQKAIIIPNDILSNYMNQEQINSFNNGSTGIYSITVYAEKPKEASCEPDSGCC